MRSLEISVGWLRYGDRSRGVALEEQQKLVLPPLVCTPEGWRLPQKRKKTGYIHSSRGRLRGSEFEGEGRKQRWVG